MFSFFIILITLTSACNVVYDYDKLDYRSLKDYGGCPEKDDWGRVWHKLCHGVVGRIYKTGGSCYKVMDICWGCLDHASEYPKRLKRVECDECPVCPGGSDTMCKQHYGNACYNRDSIECVPMAYQCKLEWGCKRFQKCDSAKKCSDIYETSGHTRFKYAQDGHGYPLLFWEPGIIGHNINADADNTFPDHKLNLEIKAEDFDGWYFVWHSSETGVTHSIQMHSGKKVRPQTGYYWRTRSAVYTTYFVYKISGHDYVSLGMDPSVTYDARTHEAELIHLCKYIDCLPKHSTVLGAPQDYNNNNTSFGLYVTVMMLTLVILGICGLFGFIFGFGFMFLFLGGKKKASNDIVERR